MKNTHLLGDPTFFPSVTTKLVKYFEVYVGTYFFFFYFYYNTCAVVDGTIQKCNMLKYDIPLQHSRSFYSQSLASKHIKYSNLFYDTAFKWQ
jgi:hypothetical protein